MTISASKRKYRFVNFNVVQIEFALLFRKLSQFKFETDPGLKKMAAHTIRRKLINHLGNGKHPYAPVVLKSTKLLLEKYLGEELANEICLILEFIRQSKSQ